MVVMLFNVNSVFIHIKIENMICDLKQNIYSEENRIVHSSS